MKTYNNSNLRGDALIVQTNALERPNSKYVIEDDIPPIVPIIPLTYPEEIDILKQMRFTQSLRFPKDDLKKFQSLRNYLLRTTQDCRFIFRRIDSNNHRLWKIDPAKAVRRRRNTNALHRSH